MKPTDVNADGHTGRMEDGLLQQWIDFAAARSEAFVGMNARSRSVGGAVHAVAEIEWIAAVRVPAAACHTAVLGGELASLEPVAEPVTCRRCLKQLGVAQDGLWEHPMLAGLDSMLDESTQTT